MAFYSLTCYLPGLDREQLPGDAACPCCCELALLPGEKPAGDCVVGMGDRIRSGYSRFLCQPELELWGNIYPSQCHVDFFNR